MGFMIVSATQKGRQTQNWKIGDEVFERVSGIIYLGNVINEEGRINECGKDRIQIGNRAYAANHHMLKSKIIKRGVKMQIQGVPGGKDLTSGECSLGQTIPI
jgi:hypothetical protein